MVFDPQTQLSPNIFYVQFDILYQTENRDIKGRVPKKIIEFSIKGWVGGSGGGQILLKKNKKNMPLKSILGHFRPTFFFLSRGGVRPGTIATCYH